MKKIAGDCNRDDCPAIYTSGGEVVVQGMLLTATEGMSFSEGEVAVTIPRHLIEEAARVLGG
ncbi:MAG TPA: hypothetical protein H9836_07355 [Candidatus Nocardiopsis merdipullorum]|jgi:hypothetical protein|nr:hypothetical protein [Candidatus Nocardiopsis merdipullorum]